MMTNEHRTFTLAESVLDQTALVACEVVATLNNAALYSPHGVTSRTAGK